MPVGLIGENRQGRREHENILSAPQARQECRLTRFPAEIQQAGQMVMRDALLLPRVCRKRGSPIQTIFSGQDF
ncbi:MAG: hypothetical protein ACJA0K_001633 [Maricaulis maris]|jgi:hypothetical protein